MNRSEVVNIAREWLDTPYVHQGRTIGHGADCVAPLIDIAMRFDLDIGDNLRYSMNVDNYKIAEKIQGILTPISRSGIKPGSILLMKIVTLPQHVGIVGNYIHGGLSLIHAHNYSKKVVEHTLSPPWLRRVIAAYDLPGVNQWQRQQ